MTMEERDEKLWEIAQRRVTFKVRIFAFIFTSVILWIIWWFTTGRKGDYDSIPWPLWVMIFWDIGIILNTSQLIKKRAVGMEYKKLKNRKS